MPIEDAVVVSVSLTSPAVSSDGFGTILLAGQNASFPERTRLYTNTDDMLTDGFADTDWEFLAAESIFNQSLHPTQIKVGRMDAFVAQVTTVTVTLSAVGTYIVTITVQDMPALSFTVTTVGGETVDDIRDDLVVGINALTYADTDPIPVTAAPTGAPGSGALTLTADLAGWGFSVTLGGSQVANLSQAATTPNNGPFQELTDIKAEDADWYGLLLTTVLPGPDRHAGHIIEASRWAEGELVRFMAQTDDADIVSATSTTDVAQRLRTLQRVRTALLWHPDDAEEAAAAWLGDRLSVDPDIQTVTWAHVELEGVTAQSSDTDGITAAQQALLEARNVNYYPMLGSRGSTWEGRTCEGEFLDPVTAADWTQVRMRADLIALFQQYSNRPARIPFTDAGIGIVTGQVRVRLERGKTIGHFFEDANNAIVVTAPRRSAVDAGDVAARRIPITFSAPLSGAIHAAGVSGELFVPAG